MSGVVGICNTPLAACCLNLSNQIWNFTTSAWEAIPASGTPAKQHVLVIPRPAPGTGSLANLLASVLPDAAANFAGCYCPILNCAADGTLAGTPADLTDVVVPHGHAAVQVVVRPTG